MTKNDLINSSNYEDRIKAAEQGYGLDVLINDKDLEVHNKVVKYLKDHNYRSVFDWAKDNNVEININKWLNSTEWTKRAEVAKFGYHLDTLINDENEYVRHEVAKHGYGIDILINDKNNYVSSEAINYLKDHKYKSVLDWAKDNNVEIDFDKWVYSDDYHKRRAVAVAGYHLDVLVHDEDPFIREAVAKAGYGLDILIKDEDEIIRMEVARHGYGLNVLINDKDNNVRYIVNNYLSDHNYNSINDWIKDNNTKIDN